MKVQRHLLMSGQQKVHKEDGERWVSHVPLLGALGGRGRWKGHVYWRLLEERAPSPVRFLSLMCFWLWYTLTLSLLSLCKESNKAGTKHFIMVYEKYLAERDNAKARRAKIRPSGSVWLGSCVHRLLRWHSLPTSLPAVSLLRAQVTCAEWKEVLLPLPPCGDDKCFWACVTDT